MFRKEEIIVEKFLRQGFLRLAQVSFRKALRNQFGVKLGEEVGEEQAEIIFRALSYFPDGILKNTLNEIRFEGDMGGVHGRWEHDERLMVINPRIFSLKKNFGKKDRTKIPESVHVIMHELMHGVDERFGFSDSYEWKNISGWKICEQEMPSGYARYVEKRSGWKGKTEKISPWIYKEGTAFVREYAKRNPAEDFCEHAFWYLSGMVEDFTGDTGKKKLDFIISALDQVGNRDT